MPNIQFSLAQHNYVKLSQLADERGVSANRLAKFIILVWMRDWAADDSFNGDLEALSNFDESIYERTK